MNCKECHDELPQGARFCISCSAPVAATGKTERLFNPADNGRTAIHYGGSAIVYGGSAIVTGPIYTGQPYVGDAHTGLWTIEGVRNAGSADVTYFLRRKDGQ